MSTATSIAARQVYGVKRVCEAWGVPRSSFYAASTVGAPPTASGKRGPKCTLDDDALLALIRADLAASPFKGEGHRRVFGRLRYVQGHRVGRNRVLRLMRLHRLLSPHRVASAPAKTHDGRICTDEPNVRWATDGAKVWTSEDGWLWVFTIVEHWNGELPGHHVCKRGDRLAAYEPLSPALLRVFGSALADVARGVELRHDHGSQYLTDYFQGQSRFHGFPPASPSSASPRPTASSNASTAPSRSRSSTGTPTKTVRNSPPLSPPSPTSTTANGVLKNSASSLSDLGRERRRSC